MADDLATATAVAAASCRSKTGGYVEACRTETKAFSNREARNFARKTTANYLLSISEDACFVSHARESLNVLDWPLLTNLRAGAWYAPTGSVDATCYFKSMDGHRNQWDFSIGRLNLHVAHMAADSGGVVLVDCTGNRRKTFPDALSKTVPIWTAVLQSMVATLKVPGTCPETFSDAFLHLRTAEAERPDILKLLPEWVEKLRKNLPEAEAMQLAAALKGRRLRPFWACPTDDLNKLRDELEALKEEHAIVLCVSASKVVAGSTSYIQGAGDDEEASGGLCEGVDAAIKALPGPPDQMDVPTQDTAKVSVADQVVCLSFIGGTGVAVGNFASAAPPRVWDCVDAVLNCGGEEHPEMKGDPRYLHLPAADEKKHDPSKRWWQEVLLPQALRFIARSLQRGEKVLIHCSRGDNRCPAVAAAALAAFFGPGGTGPFHLAKRRLEKADLRRCLVVVQCHHPNCMVPRRIMQFLNLFFVTEDGGWSTWQIAPTEEPLTVPSLLGASRASALAAGQPVADQVLTDQGFALYISGAFFAQSLPLLRQLGVSHIVNVTKAPNVFEGKFAYHQVAIEDDRSANLLQVLDAALEFIHDARTQSYNCCVLVHCREGVSRSVSVVLAYLMRFEQLCLSGAMRLLQNRRSGSCRPNAGFLQQLKAFEEALHQTQESRTGGQATSEAPTKKQLGCGKADS
ncbi:tRNA A64-2'-O-ribosylphosphate transferase [Symbiodinium microadriaticum]|uniref:tRNA A64-2'-O-ribosylphosphate transferase n=1 Tax=Symbiodinium microadriaticum TaxID=2951 RepID=A0A1Q9D547_SYMMI|nr:tRNA A64-2'-O-ribosylphosphate transferase [Symbiodinium microadriaticum]